MVASLSTVPSAFAQLSKKDQLSVDAIAKELGISQEKATTVLLYLQAGQPVTMNGKTLTPDFIKGKANQQEQLEPEEQEVETIPFQMVEQKPSFNGGDVNDYVRWIKEQITDQSYDGRIALALVVKHDGSVENVRVIRGLDPKLDEQVVRIASSSPKWTPGRQKGNPVNVEYSMLPIVFAGSGTSSVQVAGEKLPTWIYNHDWSLAWRSDKVIISFNRSSNSNRIICTVSKNGNSPCEGTYSYTDGILTIRYDTDTIRFINVTETDSKYGDMTPKPAGYIPHLKTEDGQEYIGIRKRIALKELPIVLEHSVWQYVEGTREWGARLQMEFLDSERVRFNHTTYVFGKEDYLKATYNYAVFRTPDDRFVVRIHQEVYTESSKDKPVPDDRDYELVERGKTYELYERLPDKVNDYKFIGYNR